MPSPVPPNVIGMEGWNSISTIHAGTLGTQNVASAGYAPGARRTSNCFKDNTGNFWTGFGAGYGSNPTPYSYLNDVWKYNPTTKLWTWVKGNQFANASATYGTMGIPSATGTPGGRQYAAGWFANGKYWLFGGSGYDKNGDNGYLNDLWVPDLTNPLPLTRVNLAAATINNTIIVEWQTRNEINTDKFVIERSHSGLHFVSLDSVKAYTTAQQVNHYSFTDFHPLSKNYYRLKMFEIDEKYSHSKIVEAKASVIGTVTLSPNPPKDFLYIKLNEIADGTTLRIVDTQGRILKEEPVRSTSSVINIAPLPDGVYYVVIKNKKATRQSKFIKL